MVKNIPSGHDQTCYASKRAVFLPLIVTICLPLYQPQCPHTLCAGVYLAQCAHLTSERFSWSLFISLDIHICFCWRFLAIDLFFLGPIISQNKKDKAERGIVYYAAAFFAAGFLAAAGFSALGACAFGTLIFLTLGWAAFALRAAFSAFFWAISSALKISTTVSK